MGKKINAYDFKPADYKKSNPNVHSKTKSSSHKNSKNYLKLYRGQGR